jgi:hypothetical protein
VLQNVGCRCSWEAELGRDGAERKEIGRACHLFLISLSADRPHGIQESWIVRRTEAGGEEGCTRKKEGLGAGPWWGGDTSRALQSRQEERAERGP